MRLWDPSFCCIVPIYTNPIYHHLLCKEELLRQGLIKEDIPGRGDVLRLQRQIKTEIV